ncbi:MAG TPA: hypothetical protein VFE37_29780 [Chloroflexota bacterium]|nr:hypothetical protein [Chloroflexota bacterium]
MAEASQPVASRALALYSDRAVFGVQMATSVNRRRLHELLDAVPEQDLETVQAFLEPLAAHGEPVETALPFDENALPAALREAPWDDEPLTPEEEAALAEAYDAIRRGEFVTHEELRRDLGL